MRRAPESECLSCIPSRDLLLQGWRSVRTRAGLSYLLYIYASVLIVAFASLSSCLWAQSSTTGALRGSVTDHSGKAVPGVVVTLVNGTTGKEQTAVTNENGLYSFASSRNL
jgi:hypothetical protein